MTKHLLAAIVALAAGTASAAPEKPKLDMLAFFAGRTHADNVMKVVLKKPVRLIVDSVGGRGDRGDFVLVDTVHEGDKPVRQRKWVMHPTGANRFGGSLSDATGPVDVIIDGNSATIRYTMKGGLKIEQVMHPTGANRFGGSLSDATGPVDVIVDGNSATIRYTMKGGLKIEQVMQLQPDGRTLSNHVVAKNFGLRFAKVDGTIRKLD